MKREYHPPTIIDLSPSDVPASVRAELGAKSMAAQAREVADWIGSFSELGIMAGARKMRDAATAVAEYLERQRHEPSVVPTGPFRVDEPFPDSGVAMGEGPSVLDASGRFVCMADDSRAARMIAQALNGTGPHPLTRTMDTLEQHALADASFDATYDEHDEQHRDAYVDGFVAALNTRATNPAAPAVLPEEPPDLFATPRTFITRCTVCGDKHDVHCAGCVCAMSPEAAHKAVEACHRTDFEERETLARSIHHEQQGSKS